MIFESSQKNRQVMFLRKLKESFFGAGMILCLSPAFGAAPNIEAEIDDAMRPGRTLYACMDMGEPITRKLLGLKPNHLEPPSAHSSPYPDSSKDFTELSTVVDERKNAEVAKLGRAPSAREEALAILQMPSDTPDSVLKKRLSVIDWTLNGLFKMANPHADEQAYFLWFPHDQPN
jgi:hypothetical protein